MKKPAQWPSLRRNASLLDGARRWRRRLHRQLFPQAWLGHGLSPTNKLVVGAILVAATTAVLETEPALRDRQLVGRALHAVNVCLAIIFTIEYLARVWAAGEERRYAGAAGRLRYMARPAALLDLLAVLPFYLALAGTDAFLLRLFRLMRIVTLARLGRFSDAARLLLESVHARRYEIALSFALAGVVLLLAATALYLVEGYEQPEAFGSIPRALWWSVATLTTVGYGDVYPITPLGKLFAGLTAIAAIGIIAMPTGVLAAAFSDALQQRREGGE